MTTEYVIIIEGVKYGRPFREAERQLNGLDEARRRLAKFQERIANPPASTTLHEAMIVFAELRSREVTDWASVERAEGSQEIVDAWLDGSREKVYLEDISALAVKRAIEAGKTAVEGAS